MTTSAGFMEINEAYEPTKAMADAKALAVKTATDRQQAADLWDALRGFRKQAEKQKEEKCRPLKQDWEDAKKPFDDFMKECQGHETRLQGLMSTWDREQDRLARVEQDRLQAAIDKKNEKIIAKAEERGVDAVLKVAPVVQAPPKNIVTQAGTTQGRSTKKVYGVKLVLSDSKISARDERMTLLLAQCPDLFVFDWVSFRKLASTGMMDGNPCVEITDEYMYSQRS